jgi:thioesterase domain-containing protein
VAAGWQAQGEPVALVVLLDSFAPNFPERLPWVTPGMFNFLLVLRRVQSYLWKFWILDWKGKRDLLLSAERPFHLRFREWANKRNQELHRPVRGRLARSSPVSEDTQYRDYSGKVVLLRAQQEVLGVRRDPTLGWGSWLHCPLEVQVVPGEHESILFGPRIPRVASLLNDYLEQAYKVHSGAGKES